MEIVSTTDTPEQMAAALEAHGYQAEKPVQPTAANPTDPAAPPTEQAAPPVEAGTTAPASEPDTNEQTQQQQVQPSKKKAGMQARIDELTAEKYREKGRAEELQRQIDDLKAQLAGKPPAGETPATAAPVQTGPQKPVRPKKPRQSEFDTVEEFEAADTAYDTAMAQYEEDLSTYNRQAAIDEFQRKNAEEYAKQVAQERVEALNAKIEEGKEKYPDFEAKVYDDKLLWAPALIDAIHESDNPQEVMYYLAEHPEELAAVTASTSYHLKDADAGSRLAANRAAARAVAQIEYKVGGTPSAATAAAASASPAPSAAPSSAAPAAAAPSAPPRRTSTAPAPITPLRTGTSSPAPDPNRVIGQNGWTAADEKRLMSANNPRRR
jgi:hypothetical protein